MMQRKWQTCILLLILVFSNASDAYIGISISSDIPNLESASEVVSVLQSHNIKHVRLFDTDHRMLKALADTGVEVMVSIPNDQLQAIGESQENAAKWINTNIEPFVPSTSITCIAVGNEVLSAHPEMAHVLVRAMEYLHSALLAANIHSQIKISSPQSMNLIPEPLPPSSASFSPTSTTFMIHFLQFLENTGSSFMLNAHPSIYELFQPGTIKQALDPNTHLYYSNMFDAIMDAAYHSMEALNFSRIPVLLMEHLSHDPITDNALVYDRKFIWDTLSESGTPSRPDTHVSFYINKNFDDELQHGLVSGRMMYSLDPHGVSHAVVDAAGVNFCVANQNADPNALLVGLNWACGPGAANCSAIQQGQPCYVPNNLAAIASYAYNDYYQRSQATGGTCKFNNTAVLTPNDPSHGSCIFTGSSGTGTNPGGGGTNPGGNGTTPGVPGTGTNSSSGGGNIFPSPPMGPIGPSAFDNSVPRLQLPKLNYLLVPMIMIMFSLFKL